MATPNAVWATGNPENALNPLSVESALPSLNVGSSTLDVTANAPVVLNSTGGSVIAAPDGNGYGWMHIELMTGTGDYSLLAAPPTYNWFSLEGSFDGVHWLRLTQMFLPDVTNGRSFMDARMIFPQYRLRNVSSFIPSNVITAVFSVSAERMVPYFQVTDNDAISLLVTATPYLFVPWNGRAFQTKEIWHNHDTTYYGVLQVYGVAGASSTETGSVFQSRIDPGQAFWATRKVSAGDSGGFINGYTMPPYGLLFYWNTGSNSAAGLSYDLTIEEAIS